MQQNMETRELEEVDRLMIKEKDKPNFEFHAFATILIREQYLIYDSKIFYLYSD